MRAIKEILYGTEEYAKTLALRNKVMRIPLGLNIYEEDFSSEQDALMVGMFEGENLLGVGVMSNHGPDYKLEYLCIDSEIQSCGIGASLLEHLEERAKEQGKNGQKNRARKKFQWMCVYRQRNFMRVTAVKQSEIFSCSTMPRWSIS